MSLEHVLFSLFPLVLFIVTLFPVQKENTLIWRHTQNSSISLNQNLYYSELNKYVKQLKW